MPDTAIACVAGHCAAESPSTHERFPFATFCAATHILVVKVCRARRRGIFRVPGAAIESLLSSYGLVRLPEYASLGAA